MESLTHSTSPVSVYNIWPPNYIDPLGQKSAIELMTEDLPRIKEMGFNVIYVNPLFKVGDYPKAAGDFGCPYAVENMLEANPRFFNGASGSFLDEQGNPTEGIGDQLQEFCRVAKSLDMTPMFDLVQGQLAPGSVYIERAHEQGVNLLKTYENGHYDIHNLDQNYRPKWNNDKPYDPIDIWDDTIKFNYSFTDAQHPVNEFARNEIFGPYIETMAQLGFTGMRIDSSPDTPANLHQSSALQFKNKLDELREQNPDDLIPEQPIIIAETLNNERSPNALEVVGVATHCLNSGFFFPNNKYHEDRRHVTDELIPSNLVNDPSHWLIDEVMRKQDAIHGGTITPLSTHDTNRVYNQVNAQIDHIIEKMQRQGVSEEDIEEHVQRAARVKAAFSAFLGAGGMMMTSGDEFLTNNRVNVFEGTVIHPNESHTVKMLDGESKIIRFSREEYDELMHDIVVQGEAITLDDSTYIVKEAYPKPVWQYKDHEPHEKRPMLLRLNPQIHIPELVQQREQEQEHDYSTFLKDLNHAIASNSRVIYPDQRVKMGFSQEDDKLIYCATLRAGEGAEQLVALHVINVDPKARPVELTEEEIRNEASRLLHHDMSNVANISYVGNISAKEQAYAVEREEPNTHISDAEIGQRVERAQSTSRSQRLG